jgi:hypothetical protein
MPLPCRGWAQLAYIEDGELIEIEGNPRSRATMLSATSVAGGARADPCQ